MGIYIKDMEMPLTCLSCYFHKCAAGVGDFCALTKKKQFRFKNRPSYCPLVSIQPNERLIGADNLLNTAFKLVDEETFRAFRQLVIDAPTIIPADESNMDSFIRIFEEDDEENGMDSFIRILKD